MKSTGGRGTATRKFFASGYASTSAIIRVFGTEQSGILVPNKGQGHPEYKGLVAKDFSLTPVDGHSDLYELEWTYEQVTTSYFNGPTELLNPQLPAEVGYVELSSEIRTEFSLAFRKDPDLPNRGDPGEPDANTPDDPEADIGGDPIDSGGNPTSIVRRFQELVLTETVTTPNFGQYGTFRFKRNSAIFLGAAIGRVLYRGASVRRTGLNVYQVSHSFVDDEFFHLQQTPLSDQNGRPILENGRAKRVYFVQPFEDKADFNAISGNF